MSSLTPHGPEVVLVGRGRAPWALRSACESERHVPDNVAELLQSTVKSRQQTVKSGQTSPLPLAPTWGY